MKMNKEEENTENCEANKACERERERERRENKLNERK